MQKIQYEGKNFDYTLSIETDIREREYLLLDLKIKPEIKEAYYYFDDTISKVEVKIEKELTSSHASPNRIHISFKDGEQEILYWNDRSRFMVALEIARHLTSFDLDIEERSNSNAEDLDELDEIEA
jgi:hypothetical protein